MLKLESGRLKAIGVWLAKKGDLFLDEYLKKLAGPAAILTGYEISVHLTSVQTLIASIFSLVGNLFRLLHVLL